MTENSRQTKAEWTLESFIQPLRRSSLYAHVFANGRDTGTLEHSVGCKNGRGLSIFQVCCIIALSLHVRNWTRLPPDIPNVSWRLTCRDPQHLNSSNIMLRAGTSSRWNIDQKVDYGLEMPWSISAGSETLFFTIWTKWRAAAWT